MSGQVRRWWRSGPARRRLRRRLVMVSVLPLLLVVVASIKAMSVVLAGDAAVAHFRDGDIDALRADVATLRVLDVVQRPKARFAAGGLAVLDGRLDDAEADYSAVLAQTPADEACPVRVNLLLVREAQGDRARLASDVLRARERYLGALDVAAGAPPGCFAGNDDPDAARRAVRAETEERLAIKLAILDTPPPPAPPEVGAPPPPPPPPPPPGAAPEEPPTPDVSRLEPGFGDPMQRLQQILSDAAAARNATGSG